MIFNSQPFNSKVFNAPSLRSVDIEFTVQAVSDVSIKFVNRRNIACSTSDTSISTLSYVRCVPLYVDCLSSMTAGLIYTGLKAIQIDTTSFSKTLAKLLLGKLIDIDISSKSSSDLQTTAIFSLSPAVVSTSLMSLILNRLITSEFTSITTTETAYNPTRRTPIYVDTQNHTTSGLGYSKLAAIQVDLASVSDVFISFLGCKYLGIDVVNTSLDISAEFLRRISHKFDISILSDVSVYFIAHLQAEFDALNITTVTLIPNVMFTLTQDVVCLSGVSMFMTLIQWLAEKSDKVEWDFTDELTTQWRRVTASPLDWGAIDDTEPEWERIYGSNWDRGGVKTG